MSDTIEGAIARVRVVLDVGAIGPKLEADLRAILDHIEAQAAEIERLQNEVRFWLSVADTATQQHCDALRERDRLCVQLKAAAK